MLKASRSLAILLFFFAVVACRQPRTAGTENYYNCLECHEGVEEIDSHHKLSCHSCHLLPEDRLRKTLADHGTIIRNPSDPAHMDAFCITCHEEDIKVVRNSLHATMAGVINQTRYLWGAQERAAPAAYGLSGPFELLPAPDPMVYPESPRDLVDDFLRRRCLRCHINAPGSRSAGLYRGTGCAACHVIYANDGRYRGDDRAIKPSSEGYPVKHRLTRHIPNGQCLHCHNENHVGADYEGLFEHDFSSTYRSPIIKGRPIPRIYGLDYHRLAKDVHSERGLWCIDCHGRADVMGDGRAYSHEMEVSMMTCEDCHGGFENPRPRLPSPMVRETSGGFLFFSEHQDRTFPLPLFLKDSTGHRVKSHASMRCSACHAQWSFQDYGLSVIREDGIAPYKWHKLSAQGDPDLERILSAHFGKPANELPLSRDLLSGKMRPGIWSLGWRFRRWELMPLGLDAGGRYAVLRPLYQYFISYVDRMGNNPLDSVVPSRGDGSGKGWAYMPYVPHTIAPFGRQCEGCHLNRVAAGLGITDEKGSDAYLTAASPPALKDMRLMTTEEQERLLRPSWQWRRERLRALTRQHGE